MQSTVKDPQAIENFVFDWTGRLNGDTISTSTWTAPSGITVVSSGNTTVTTTVKLSGGTLGTIYDVVNQITTAGGQTLDETLSVTIQTA